MSGNSWSEFDDLASGIVSYEVIVVTNNSEHVAENVTVEMPEQPPIHVGNIQPSETIVHDVEPDEGGVSVSSSWA